MSNLSVEFVDRCAMAGAESSSPRFEYGPTDDPIPRGYRMPRRYSEGFDLNAYTCLI